MKRVVLVIAALALGACDNGNPDRLSRGPDEFAIVPVKPLEMPATAELPVPTTGSANRVDLNPLADGVAALGGHRGTLTGQIPVADGVLVNYASRAGVSSDIRTVLAAEDKIFIKRRRRLLGPELPYDEMRLDPYLLIDGYRARGYRVPTPPPLTDEQQ
ncbi:DUF3035 domain-containing protein [Donghicola sp. C2-DW-16]|uniref:DUF3035 domain-containing protein n=1 Tax=Donghicola mangrovi TaxID=2729614 RepID=A0ABX2PAU6_9RHOB|nr:DUF3035 domain-containing protein [Donghicola mangrovi]NVO25819.1 DUF3035 domain-containing protein [Donghicola mangrovi]